MIDTGKKNRKNNNNHSINQSLAVGGWDTEKKTKAKILRGSIKIEQHKSRAPKKRRKENKIKNR